MRNSFEDFAFYKWLVIEYIPYSLEIRYAMLNLLAVKSARKNKKKKPKLKRKPQFSGVHSK